MAVTLGFSRKDCSELCRRKSCWWICLTEFARESHTCQEGNVCSHRVTSDSQLVKIRDSLIHMARHCGKRSSHRVRLRKGESPAESRSLKKNIPQLLIGQGQKSFSISHSWLWASYGFKERPAEGLRDLCVSQQRLCCTAGPANHMIW